MLSSIEMTSVYPWRVQLSMAMKISQFEKTPSSKFLPAGALDRFMTEKSILRAMNVSQPTTDDLELVKFVTSKGRKLFAIASYIKGLEGARLRKAMALFQAWPFHDDDLPIEEIPGDQIVANLLKGDLHKLMQIEGEVQNDNHEIWNLENILDFQNEQNKFLAPIFSDDTTTHDVWDLALPFTKKHTTKAEGSFGVVSKYEIHKDHMRDKNRPSNVSYNAFAVKEIKADNNNDRQRINQHWQSEVRAMETMNRLAHKGHIVHFVTAFRRGTLENGILKNPDYYIVTEWAEGGNLRDFWNRMPRPKFTVSLVKEVLKQLLGLAEAFNAAHNLQSGGVTSGASYRHGDLKPANILCFPDGSQIGVLKVCDWGEAKNKQVATAMRHSRTTAEFGTRRYEPPEVDTGVRSMLGGKEENRRSRLYDIWALGCITLEFIVWLVYGLDGLERFNKSVKSELNNDSPFYQPGEESGKRIAWVHNVVTYWMNYMAEDAACRAGTTALGDLLEIVQAGLLVVKLPREGGTFYQSATQKSTLDLPPQQLDAAGKRDDPTIPSASSVLSNSENVAGNKPSIEITPAEKNVAEAEPRFLVAGPARLRANQLRDRLESIVLADEDNTYWSTVPTRSIPDIPADLYGRKPNYATARKFRQSGVDYGQPRLDPDKWTYKTDNSFARKVFSKLTNKEQFSILECRISSKLCKACQSFRDNVLNPFFHITYNVQELENKATSRQCDLCVLLWRTCERYWGAMFPEVSFERDGSFLTMNRGPTPVLSLSRPLDYKNRKAADIQIGFSELPEAGNATHLEVVRQWLSNCDEKHQPPCQPIHQASKQTPLPTRLIDVGEDSDHIVHLWETSPGDSGEWIALSHRWGSDPEDHFSTTTDNLASHKAGIKTTQLPATFRDAVIVTRALGCRYLWIDSICIVQRGPKADFEQEAERMEDVYSGARCVIAASCANSHTSGFLKPREKRDYVALRREQDGKAPLFVCQMIDDFKKHVLDGELHQRGWVLQEHALARRTIFFDQHQTYYECGYGVQCETMSTLNNESAKLLSDPNFPQILGTAMQGERILRFQELYQQYSRLGLSKHYDRPIAIAGLQKRILRTMGVRGDFGMFDDDTKKGLLRRSLLWYRGNDTPSLSRIEFPEDQSVPPSWSWMAWTGGKTAEGKAYPGGIDYFDLEFGGFDWEDLRPPWLCSDAEKTPLTAHARQYEYGGPVADESLVVLDSPAEPELGRVACVVLGVQAGSFSSDQKRHYLLIIAETEDTAADGVRFWERIGAGFLTGRSLRGNDFPVNIR